MHPRVNNGICDENHASYAPLCGVFLNHRGPDLKATFATDLYRCLVACGFNVFLDEPEMQAGHDITCQIKQAIENSSIHIAIFSPTYAESSWCLNELEHMWEMHESDRATILPIFYDVQPSQLRHTGKGQTGMYAKALWNREEKGANFQTIQKWRKALRGAAGISGFELKKYNSDEELLGEVVGHVLDIREKKRLKYVTKDEFERTIHNCKEFGRIMDSCKAKVMGIAGPRGVGKTTLAKTFFDSKRSEYSGSCFLSNVKESSRDSLNRKLKEELPQNDTFVEGIYKILKLIPLSCIAKILKLIPSSFAHRKVLIVLDDLDQADQMDVLSPHSHRLGSNSLILVTSRDKNVLEGRIRKEAIYNLTEQRHHTPRPRTNLILAGSWLEELPAWLTHLTSLKELWIRDSPKLKSLSSGAFQLPNLPVSYQLLNRLTVLTIMDCGIRSLLQALEKMNNLQVLRLCNCPLSELSFRQVQIPTKVLLLRESRRLDGPSKTKAPFPVGVNCHFQHLWINSCRDLVEVGSLPYTLKTLDLRYCNRLRKIAGLRDLGNLEQLDISGCEEVEELPGLESLKHLESLKASRCYKLRSIIGLTHLIKLRELYVRQCHEILHLPGVEHLLCLKKLDASGCLKIQWPTGVLEQLRQRLNEDFSYDVK